MPYRLPPTDRRAAPYRLAVLLCAGLILSLAVLSGALGTFITNVTVTR